MGLRHGDPSLVYRWSREDQIAAYAAERVQNEPKPATPAATPPQPGPSAGFLTLPQVKAATPEARRFWGSP